LPTDNSCGIYQAQSRECALTYNKQKNHEQNKFKRQGRHAHDNGAGGGDPKRNRAGERRQSSGRQFFGTRSERRRA
jgi:hypothetical protein